MANLQKEQKDGIDISNLINDVNRVLHQHLTNILTPMLNEKKSIQQVLLNMPMVKQLQDEHLRTQQAIFAIQAEAKAMKLFYEGELQSKNEELTNVKKELLVALKQLEEYKNVKLEVKDMPTKPDTPPVEIKNDTIRKNTKIVEQSSTIKLANMNNLNAFSSLAGDSEDEPETDEEAVDSEEEEVVAEESDDDDDEDDDKDEEEEDTSAEAAKDNEEKNEDDEDEDDEDEDDEDEDEEDEEDEEEEDEEDEDEEDEDEEDEDEEDEEEEGDFEVEDVTIDGTEYVATNTINGTIYKLDSEGEILENENGDFVKAGYYKNGISFIL